MSWLGKQKEKHRLKKLYEVKVRCGYYSPGGAWLDRDKGYYFRTYPYSTNHDNNKKSFLKIANRKVRRRLGNEEAVNRGAHKKMFDLWWTLY